MKDAAKVVKDATQQARRRGTCAERIGNGQDHDACGFPAVLRTFDGTALCASCAEDRINALERRLASVREAVK